MPKRVEFEGVVHEFPDDFTDAEIQAALSSAPAPVQTGGGLRRIADALPLVGGMVGGMAGGVVGAGVGGAAGRGFGTLIRRGAEIPGAVADVARNLVEQPGATMRGFGEGALEGAGQAAVSGGTQAALEGVGRGIQLIGKGFYKGGVALLPKTLKQQYPDIAKTGFREGIALTRRGAEKARRLVTASRSQADATLAAAEKAGAQAVQPRRVIQSLRPVRDKMRSQAALGLADDTPGLAQRAKLFATRNKGGIGLTKANTLKREAQDLANTAYAARDRGAVINSMDALTNEAQARGLREAIEGIVPEVGPINARTQSLMGVARGAEHASETAHILPRLLAAGGTGAVAGGAGLVPALGAAASAGALATSGGLTRTGLLAKQAGRITAQMIRAALLAQMLEHPPQE